MSAKKPLVIVTRKLPDVIETRLMELFNTRLNLEDTPLSKSELAAAVTEADVLVPDANSSKFTIYPDGSNTAKLLPITISDLVF